MSKVVDIARLKKIASSFRSEFEKNSTNDAPGFLSKFPEGCCNWASYMIGNYLKYEQGLNAIEIQAQRYNSESDSHSWLVVEEIIIDITSDEFDDSDKKVIVSEKSKWHDTWNIEKRVEIRHIEDYDKIDYGTKLKPSEFYQLLAGEVRKSCT